MGMTVTSAHNMCTWFESGLFGLMSKEERRATIVFQILGLDKAQILFIVIFKAIPEISGTRSAGKLVLNYKYFNIKISRR